jgi:hypothetical protein
MPPALKAYVTDHVWSFGELVAMMDKVVANERANTSRKMEKW